VVSNFLLQDLIYSLCQEVRDALGNIADLEKFSRDLVRDASEAGPSGSSLFTDTTPVQPLDSAEDFTEIEELADDSDNFKVNTLLGRANLTFRYI
jgi:hypothetical protein